jgi:transcriptional regulator with XRE-family HTH domain
MEPDSIARGLRRVRTEMGLQQHEVAEMLGVHTSTVSRIESGTRKVRWSSDARDIADRLGVRIGYLLRDCPQCGYEPPAGYQCLRCGTPSRQQTTDLTGA